MIMNAICPKCNQPIKEGEFVTNLTWNGDGGQHIVCPQQEESCETSSNVSIA